MTAELNWKEIDKGIKPNRWISQVEASRHTDGTVYMSQNGKRNDDMTPYLWKSTDFGKTWQSIVANIPSGPINVIREDPKNKDVLYVGTDLGSLRFHQCGGKNGMCWAISCRPRLFPIW